MLNGPKSRMKGVPMPRKARVLVIDDDPLFRNLIAGLLKNYYAVTTAESGSEGLKLALERAPHAVLIDVRMAGWNGLTTLQKFREHPELAATKTAMLTGDASRETVVAAIRSGADEYIVKTNFSKTELLNKLGELLATSSLPLEEEVASESAKSSIPQFNPPHLSSEIEAEGEEVLAAVSEPPRESKAASNPDARLQDMIDDWE